MKKFLILLALVAFSQAAPTPADVKETPQVALSRPSPINPDVLSDPKPSDEALPSTPELNLHRHRRDEQTAKPQLATVKPTKPHDHDHHHHEEPPKVNKREANPTDDPEAGENPSPPKPHSVIASELLQHNPHHHEEPPKQAIKLNKREAHHEEGHEGGHETAPAKPHGVIASESLQHSPHQGDEPPKHAIKLNKREAHHEEGHEAASPPHQAQTLEGKIPHDHLESLHLNPEPVTSHKVKREAHHEEGHHEDTASPPHQAQTLEGKVTPEELEALHLNPEPVTSHKAKREAHHEEGHHEDTASPPHQAQTLQGKVTPEELEALRLNPATATSHKLNKREAHHEEGHHEDKEDKEDTSTEHTHVPAVAVAISQPLKTKREAPSKPEDVAHHAHPESQTTNLAHEHHDNESDSSQRPQRDIPVPTEIKTTSAPAANKGDAEHSTPSGFPLRHRPIPVDQLFHKQKPASSEESKEKDSKEKDSKESDGKF